MLFIVSEYWTLIGADEARVLQCPIRSYTRALDRYTRASLDLRNSVRVSCSVNSSY